MFRAVYFQMTPHWTGRLLSEKLPCHLALVFAGVDGLRSITLGSCSYTHAHPATLHRTRQKMACLFCILFRRDPEPLGGGAWCSVGFTHGQGVGHSRQHSRSSGDFIIYYRIEDSCRNCCCLCKGFKDTFRIMALEQTGLVFKP